VEVEPIHQLSVAVNLRGFRADFQNSGDRLRGVYLRDQLQELALTGSQVRCRGFWRRNRDKFALGQFAQRLRMVRFVSVNVLGEKS
jgi:hypothetical protein